MQEGLSHSATLPQQAFFIMTEECAVYITTSLFAPMILGRRCNHVHLLTAMMPSVHSLIKPLQVYIKCRIKSSLIKQQFLVENFERDCKCLIDIIIS